jgi:hypothetical protein
MGRHNDRPHSRGMEGYDGATDIGVWQQLFMSVYGLGQQWKEDIWYDDGKIYGPRPCSDDTRYTEKVSL